MKKIIAAMFLAALFLCLAGCALAATPASVVETGTGVSVIPSSQWEATYPDIYASYMATEQDSEVSDYVADYPMIAVVYEGMAFNTYYASARGHYYCVKDVTETGRPHKLANCFTCKTADFTHMANEQGVSAYAIPFEEAQAGINESVGCYSCHANDPAKGITVTHTYLADAMGADMDKVAAANAACGQCHVEYYFAPDTKAATLPYTSLEVMTPDAMYEYYQAMDFSDYTNPRTGVRQLKAQHPEYETFLGAGSVHASMFTCADCHMEKVTKEDGTVYRSHTLMSPLKSETIMASCAPCHQDLAGFVHGIQEKMEARTIEIGNKLEELTNKLADAVASGKYTEEELDVIRGLNRKGLWYWDFVFVENSEGAHNSRLDNDCLDKAEAIVNEALALFK
jgi:nitrite reductase (cytochrome c-552)